ncbi:hypothetical protein D3C85_717520 [compost metagenome]
MFLDEHPEVLGCLLVLHQLVACEHHIQTMHSDALDIQLQVVMLVADTLDVLDIQLTQFIAVVADADVGEFKGVIVTVLVCFLGIVEAFPQLHHRDTVEALGLIRVTQLVDLAEQDAQGVLHLVHIRWRREPVGLDFLTFTETANVVRDGQHVLLVHQLLARFFVVAWTCFTVVQPIELLVQPINDPTLDGKVWQVLRIHALHLFVGFFDVLDHFVDFV